MKYTKADRREINDILSEIKVPERSLNPYIQFKDIRETELARLLVYPGTINGDLYARAVRKEVNEAIAAHSLVFHQGNEAYTVPLILSGVLRMVRHDMTVVESQLVLHTAFEVIERVVPGFKWNIKDEEEK